MKRLLERVEEFWCMNMHGQPMWPSRGRYQCRVCLRQYPVRFEASVEEGPRRENVFGVVAAVARRA